MSAEEGCGLYSLIFLVSLLGLIILVRWAGYEKGFSDGHESGYVQACKDIAAGKSRAELRTLPGGEKKWILKTEKEIRNAD